MAEPTLELPPRLEAEVGNIYQAAFDYDSLRKPPLHFLVRQAGINTVVDEPLNSRAEAYDAPRVSLSGGVHAPEGEELVEVAKKLRKALGATKVFALEPSEGTQAVLDRSTGRRMGTSPVPPQILAFIRDEIARIDVKEAAAQAAKKA